MEPFESACSNTSRQVVKELGGTYVEDIDEVASATHLIACTRNASLKRTAKLLVCLASNTENIVYDDWLNDSVEAGKFLPTRKYLILNDKEAEKKYGFTMKETLQRIQSGGGTKILEGWSVYLCNGVAGDKAPSKQEFQCIVDATGAEWLGSQKELKAAGPKKLLVLTGVTGVERQLKVPAVKKALAQGALAKSFKELFDVIILQVCNW